MPKLMDDGGDEEDKANCKRVPMEVDSPEPIKMDEAGNVLPGPAQGPLTRTTEKQVDGFWMMEQEGAEFEDAEERWLLPENAEHLMQPMQLPEVGEDLDEFKVSIGNRLNDLGMDVWKSTFPKLTDMNEFNCCPGDLPAFWGIEPSEFLPQRIPDIDSRLRMAKRQVHPDKHPNATTQQLQFLTEYCVSLDNAAEKANNTCS